MDKTIEVVLVAVVVIATAAIMLFIFTGESGSFSEFISSSSGDAKCDLAAKTCNKDSFNANSCSEKGYESFSSLNCEENSGSDLG